MEDIGNQHELDSDMEVDNEIAFNKCLVVNNNKSNSESDNLEKLIEKMV